MKLKKLSVMALAAAMILNLGVTSFANEWTQQIDPEVEIQRALDGISDVPVPFSLENAADACMIDEDGNEIPVDVKMTVRKLDTVSTFSDDAVEHYAVTAVTRASTHASGQQSTGDLVYNTVAYGTIYYSGSVASGYNLDQITGGWEIGGQGVTASNRSVTIAGSTLPVHYYPTSNSFYERPYAKSGTGTFTLVTTATLHKNSGSKNLRLEFRS